MHRRNVLIVDDDALFCWALQKELTLHHLNACIANTGQECLQAVKATRFDMLFLSVHLPDADGIDLLAKIRKISPGSRAVVVSWDGTASNKKAALSAGAEQFLEKPFDIGVVTRFVSHAFREEPCRRSASRYLCNFPLRISILDPTPEEAHFFLGSMRGAAEDVGQGGIRLTTDYPLRAGQRVRLMIDGEPDPFAQMIPGGGCAEVVWAVSRGNQFTAGLRFLPALD
ncbi:MAG: response regulator [Deltaproteobacteria bacterium]|nr:response regulator [Deltaproteobacteria bacterium]